jgi:hypothetical protein
MTLMHEPGTDGRNIPTAPDADRTAELVAYTMLGAALNGFGPAFVPNLRSTRRTDTKAS